MIPPLKKKIKLCPLTSAHSILAVVLAFFFGPFGMFYAGVGWGFLAILLTFVSMFMGCAIALLNGAIDGWFHIDYLDPYILYAGLVIGYGVMHPISLVFSPVVVHYKRQDQLDEIDEMEAKQPRAANRIALNVVVTPTPKLQDIPPPASNNSKSYDNTLRS